MTDLPSSRPSSEVAAPDAERPVEPADADAGMPDRLHDGVDETPEADALDQQREVPLDDER